MDRAEQGRRWYRARAKWEAAKLCSDQGFFSECVTLYHYACYQAMWIALGDPPAGVWRHGGLINAFCRGHWQTPSAPPQGLAPLRKKLDRLYVERVAEFNRRSSRSPSLLVPCPFSIISVPSSLPISISYLVNSTKSRMNLFRLNDRIDLGPAISSVCQRRSFGLLNLYRLLFNVPITPSVCPRSLRI